MLKSGIYLNVKSTSLVTLKKIYSSLSYIFFKFFKKNIFIKFMPLKKIEKFNIMRSPFIFKKSRDSFEIRWFSFIFYFPFNASKEADQAYQNFFITFFTSFNEKLNNTSVKIKKIDKINFIVKWK